MVRKPPQRRFYLGDAVQHNRWAQQVEPLEVRLVPVAHAVQLSLLAVRVETLAVVELDLVARVVGGKETACEEIEHVEADAVGAQGWDELRLDAVLRVLQTLVDSRLDLPVALADLRDLRNLP